MYASINQLPEPALIRHTRRTYGHTLVDACERVGRFDDPDAVMAWAGWEAGDEVMPLEIWDRYLYVCTIELDMLDEAMRSGCDDVSPDDAPCEVDDVSDEADFDPYDVSYFMTFDDLIEGLSDEYFAELHEEQMRLDALARARRLAEIDAADTAHLAAIHANRQADGCPV